MGRTQGYQPRKEEPMATRRTFTTGDVARVCGVSQQIVIREFDRGNLTGFRVPGSRFRRITRIGLLLWMDANNIPQTFLTDYQEDAA